MSELIRGENQWQMYRKFVGAKIYYRGFTEEVVSQVLATPQVEAKIDQVARKRNVKRSVVRAQARKQVEFFVARLESHKFIRFAAWSVGGLMKSVYDQGVWVDEGEIKRLKETARIAGLKKQSLIFLPCHRSHIDYVSLQLIYFQLGLSLPNIVAGDNLNFPLVGPFLQNAGAFWIKRETPTEEINPLYPTLMSGYIDTLMSRGLNYECFIEGGRSRTGKMLPPKFGMLKLLCDSLLRLDRDAIIIPVSIQYDNVLETQSYANELLGTPKTKESLSSFFAARKVLGLRMGRIDARFGKGFNVRDYIRDSERDLGFDLSKPGSDERAVFNQNSVKILRSLGYKVLNDINDVSVVMPTALVGTILLTIRGRGVGKSEFVRRMAWLTEKIRAKGSRVASIDDYEAVFEKAISVLGPLVGIRKDLIEETYYAADRFRISYFRNQVIHLFISEAIICVALYAKVKAGGAHEQQRMSKDELHERTSFLSRILKAEFIYNAQGIERNMADALQQLERDGVVHITDDYVELSERERHGGRENFDFYCFLLWPFVETYWFAAVCLFSLTPHSSTSGAVLVTDFEKLTQTLGKTLFYQGDLSYITAISKDTLQNAVQFYATIGAVKLIRGARRKDGRLELSPSWIPTRDSTDGSVEKAGKLWDLCEQIAVLRREGKNRRDNETVGRRVINLVDQQGAELQKSSLVGGDKRAKL
ncbi:hypothetical protein PYCC9005_003914 [Savitreella phatthalungensis]